jgi:hypothetical protein
MSDGPTTRFGVLAYGSLDRLHEESYAALLTIQAYAPSGSRFVVMTDQPERYRWFEDSVTIESLSAARLREWRGPTDDRYRPKIEALRLLARERDAHVVLADADTLARRDLTPLVTRLDQAALFLHRREYLLSAPPHRGDRALRHEILGRTWDGITPTARTAMWNGGIVAAGRVHAGVFDRVAEVFDRMRLASCHFAIEQLAYSVVFEAYGTIEEAAPWFDHYWANRMFFGRAIERQLLAVFMKRMTLRDAVDWMRAYPITGPLDGRPTRWQRVAAGLLRHAAGARKRLDECDD